MVRAGIQPKKVAGDLEGLLYEVPHLSKPEKPKTLQPKEHTTPLNIEELAAILEPGGEFARHFPEFEHRSQQVQVLKAVGQTISNGNHLMVEAGTGVGKSLAYLIPAAFWAKQNGERVVISTNTIALQDQLVQLSLSTPPQPDASPGT
jgi:ABC-type transport system involved in cytochrome bd biosynthesis fused ATPase/permease subunit